MRPATIAGLAATLLCASAPSAFAVTVWQGDLFLTTATKVCRDAGFNINSFFRGIFRPANISDNGANTLLAIVGSRNAQRFAVAGALGAKTYNGTMITSRAGVLTWSDSFLVATAKPGAISDTTQAVILKIKVNNFADTAGCVATLEGTVGLRPD